VDWSDSPAVDEESGLSVSSRIVSWLDPGGQRVVLQETFRIRRGRSEESVALVHHIPLLTSSAYRHLLGDVGFEVRSYSGYEEQPESCGSPMLCFAARKGGC